MKRTTLTVFISLYNGQLDEVAIFERQKDGRAHYDEKVKEVFGSEKEYRKALSNGFPAHRFHLNYNEVIK